MPLFTTRVRKALEKAERGDAGDPSQVMTAQFVSLMGISRQVATKMYELSATIATMRAGGGGADIRKFLLTKGAGHREGPELQRQQVRVR